MMYRYKARPVRVVDGDTIEVVVDLGFGLTMGTPSLPFRIRVLGVDTPELHATDQKVRQAALAAKAFTARWIEESGADAWPLIIDTEKDDSFGRWLAKVSRPDGSVLGDELLKSAMAIERLKK